jgi:hypothetical protein
LTKYPALVSLAAALVVCIGLAVFWSGTSRNVDESTGIYAAVFVLFPFTWLFLWLVIHAVGWWREQLMGAAPTPQDDSDPPNKT